jgi:predicted nucleic acid-binding protein
VTVAFDNTMLSILLNPNGQIPSDKETGLPVSDALARAEHVVQLIQRARRKIVLPAPACAELLTAIGPDAQQYINVVGRSRVFEIGSFDARCAAELALLNRGTFKAQDDRDRAEPYQKRKVDRQILAICKVYGATELYTDDRGLANRARLCGIAPVGIGEVAIPDSARQREFQLEEHEAIPAAEDARPE